VKCELSLAAQAAGVAEALLRVDAKSPANETPRVKRMMNDLMLNRDFIEGFYQ
jgi:hypothetical protein